MAKQLLRIGLIALVYFLLARVSLLLQFESSNATPVWPPSGFALAVILIFGFRLAPAIGIGAFSVNLVVFLSNGAGLPGAVLFSSIVAIGNMLEALAGYYLLHGLIEEFEYKDLFQRANHVFIFCFTAVVMCIVSAGIASSTLYFTGTIAPDLFPDVFLTWWLGDVAGVLLFTPLILIWAGPRKKIDWNSRKWLETLLFFGSVFIASRVVFNHWLITGFLFSRAFWIIPVLLWGAFRFRQREALTAVAISSAIAFWGTYNSQGPFVSSSLNESLLTSQVFVSIISLVILIITAILHEQKQARAALQEARNQLDNRVKERTFQLAGSNFQLQKQNEFVETLLDASVDQIMSYDKNMCFLSFNKKCEEIYGLKREDVIGKNILDLFPVMKNTSSYEDLVTALCGIPVHNSKFKSVIRADKYYENYLIPLRDSRNEVYGVLAITHDITENVEAAENFKELYDQLEKKNEELIAFAYIASHDLQEPLRKIQTFSHRILESEASALSDKGKEYFNRMQNAAKRMRQLIEDLLNYSKTGTAKHFENSDLNTLLEQVKEDLREKISAAGAVIQSSPLPVLPVIPFQFKQLLTNLIGNSIKFSKPGVPPRITIQGGFVDSGEIENVNGKKEVTYFHLSVSDNGIGFNPDYNNHVFGLFKRLHGRREYDGTGIGLSICKRIVENHDGIINAIGSSGEGATFNIYLPVQSVIPDLEANLTRVES